MEGAGELGGSAGAVVFDGFEVFVAAGDVVVEVFEAAVQLVGGDWGGGDEGCEGGARQERGEGCCKVHVDVLVEEVWVRLMFGLVV